MTLRRLVPADAGAYRALMLEAYALHPEAFTTSAAERANLPLAWWETRLAPGDDAHELVVGAFAGPALAGAAGLAFEQREKTRHKATLFGMYVPQAQRRRGLGDALVAAVLAAARARPGLRHVLLTVTDGNAGARRLYERHGFRSWGVEPNAVRVGEGCLAKVHMVCPLTAPARPPQ